MLDPKRLREIWKRLADYHLHQNDAFAFFPEEIPAVRSMSQHAADDMAFLLKQIGKLCGKLYFAHPVNLFGSELEKFLLHKIREQFAGWEIEDPSEPQHAAGYKKWKEGLSGNPMDYYTLELLPCCGAGIFLPFRDGAWGAGVYLEAECFVKRGKPIWKITPEGEIEELEFANMQPLSVEATRARIRDLNGSMLAY